MEVIALTPHFRAIRNDRWQLEVVGCMEELLQKYHPAALSVEKWWAVVRFYSLKPGEVLKDRGVHTCALCQAYFDKTCSECPVTDEDEAWDCMDTPYGDYVTAVSQENSALASFYARWELEFLIKRLRGFSEVRQVVQELLAEEPQKEAWSHFAVTGGQNEI